MSRLDDEYSPAEHHDLDRIDRSLPDPASAVTFTAVCACGWTSNIHGTDRDSAWRAWDRHRHREWFG